MDIPWDTLGKNFPVLVQLAMATATFFLAFTAYKQFRESILQRKKALALKTYYYLRTRQKTLEHELDEILQGKPGSELAIEDDSIREAEIFLSFSGDTREKLIDYSNKYNELHRKQRQRKSGDNKSKMEQLLRNMLEILKNEIKVVEAKLANS